MSNTKAVNCIIVDDELSSQRVLEHFIVDTKILNLKTICNNTNEAFKYLQLHTDIDLLFLDINMPKQSGIDFYKQLINPPLVIFTTAYPQYAIEGFEVNAIDYLLKPIAYERFLTAINKVLNAQKTTMADDFIILNENKTLHKVYFQDILFVEAFGDYVKVHLEHKIIITLSTFTKFLDQLPKIFLRTHKSFCINLNHMNSISGNQIKVRTHQVPIGQSYKQSVLKALNI